MMQDELAVAEGGAQLSQPMRVIDTLVAPSKTFTDIRRSAACWLPIVLMVILSLGSSWTISKTVGFAAAAETQITKNPKAEQQMSELPPDQRAQRMSITVTITKVISYMIPVVVLILVALEALVLWASFNFGLGAQTTFPKVFAVIIFAGIPRYFLWVLSIILLWAKVGTDNFDMKNPVGTNLGYYLSDSPMWLQTLGGYFDVFGLWALALLIIGMAIITGKKISQSATIILGWWLLVVLVSTGIAAI